MSRNAYFEKSSKRNGRGQVLRIQRTFREAWNQILAGLNSAENVTVRTLQSLPRDTNTNSGKKTRVIFLFLLSVKWTFFFPENGNWKLGEDPFSRFVFDSTVWNQLDFIRNKFQVFGERDLLIELKITSFWEGGFFWWCWFTSYEISFLPLFLGWLFDQRGRIILDTDPFVISFLYCVSEYQEGAEKELWRWLYIYKIFLWRILFY